MKLIFLSQGRVTQVSDEDYKSLSQYKWYAHKRRGVYYAARNSKAVGGKRYQIQMHRQIMAVTDVKIVVDHKDHDTLNNQRENLRICSQAQNTANKRSRKNSSSKFLGVSYAKRLRKWRVMIMKDGKNMLIGAYESEELAALKYNEAAEKYHGVYANLNTL